MYLFSRQRTANPASMRTAMGWAVEACQRVTTITGSEVHLWGSVFSGPVGSVLWTVAYDHLEDLEPTGDKLMADSGYADFVEQGAAHWITPPSDALWQTVHGAPAGEPPAYISTVVAETVPGTVADAMALGAEIAETASRLTGHPTMFMAAVTGVFDGVAWSTAVPNLRAMEEGQAALQREPSWLGLLERAGRVYRHGAQTRVLRRLV
jgi:hypothetical protein